MANCYCHGVLQPGPSRTVHHGPYSCTSTPTDGTPATHIVPVGRCPFCRKVRVLAAAICHGCPFSEVTA